MKRKYIHLNEEPLSLFLLSHPDISRETAIALLEDYEKHSILRNKDVCQICDVKLTPEERATIGMEHFIRTCKTHRKYGVFFQLETIRKQLGHKPRQFYFNRHKT